MPIATSTSPAGRDPSCGDRTAAALIAFLEATGAQRQPHAAGRTLLEHLIGTYEVVRRWDQPTWLQHAALIHSAYGSDVYHDRLLPLSRRPALTELAGARAERLAYLFGATAREDLFAGTHVWAPEAAAGRPHHDRTPPADSPASRDELDALVLLHMANLADQASAADRSPAVWLVKLRELAELLIDSHAIRLPLFVAELARLTERDESLCRRAYHAGLAEVDAPESRANRLALAAAVCPVVAEPCLWQAVLSHARGDGSIGRHWAERGRARLLALGTPWDKRLTFDEWLELARMLAQPRHPRLTPSFAAIAEPRTLFEEIARACAGSQTDRGAPGPRRPAHDDAAGRRRFQRYMDAIAHADGSSLRTPYPDLDSRPWFDASELALAAYLEQNHEEIRDEILALEPSRFQREAERIDRSGDWDVVFLYERGRRHDDVCQALPVTTRGIETHTAMRTAAGLIYVSRMRAQTHIAAHRGPTNLRVRCHLGVKVPRGDCAIRVGGETRHWAEGRCLVFDDYFEHEAWNHTAEDRIVLIADLWHPGLSALEVRLLEGLHRYGYAQGRQLARYWASNRAAAAAGSPGGPQNVSR